MPKATPAACWIGAVPADRNALPETTAAQPLVWRLGMVFCLKETWGPDQVRWAHAQNGIRLALSAAIDAFVAVAALLVYCVARRRFVLFWFPSPIASLAAGT